MLRIYLATLPPYSWPSAQICCWTPPNSAGPTCAFICAFICGFICAFICAFICPFICAFICGLMACGLSLARKGLLSYQKTGSKSQTTNILRMVPTLAHYSGMASEMSPGSIWQKICTLEVRGFQKYILMNIRRKWTKKNRPCLIHQCAFWGPGPQKERCYKHPLNVPFEVPDLKRNIAI